jgi:hypothetical protein
MPVLASGIIFYKYRVVLSNIFYADNYCFTESLDSQKLLIIKLNLRNVNKLKKNKKILIYQFYHRNL